MNQDPKAPTESPWKTLNSKVVYETPWIKVKHHEVITPGGSESIYGTVHFQHLAIGIVPVDAEGNTWLVGQYRYPIAEYCWEIPEGGGNLNDTPLESAQRELKEETGIVAQRWELIQEMQVSNSATDEYAYIYLARDLTFHAPSPDEDEDLKIWKLPLIKAIEMVMDGTIKDSLSVAGLLRAKVALGL